MAEEHPNVTILKKFDPRDPTGTVDAFAEDAVFHYFNAHLPELHGDHVGRAGIRAFFERLAAQTKGTFRVEPVSVTPVGDELLVVQTKNTLVLADRRIETDVVVVWRMADDHIAEVWDIPSVRTAKTSPA